MRPHNKTETPPKEAIEALYVGESLSLRETAARLGVSVTPLQRWMRELDIPIRTVAQARKVAKKHVYSEETLEKMRQRAADMRLKVTPDAVKRGAEKRIGRPAYNKGQPMSEETRRKLREAWARPGYKQKRSEMLRGEKSPHWKGGVKPEISARLDRWEWREIRKRVYERDRWICQDCGVKCRNTADSKRMNQHRRKIQAHHIVARRDGGTDDLANLVTLCMSCHHKREQAEKNAVVAGR